MNTVRSDLDRLLERLDAADGVSRDVPSTRDGDYPFRQRRCIARFEEPGSKVPREVPIHPRLLSATRLHFLVPHFVHPGTRCATQLITRAGTWTDVDGVIESCRFVEARYHETICRFQRPIRIEYHCHHAEHLTLALIESNESSASLAQRALAPSRVELTHATTIDAYCARTDGTTPQAVIVAADDDTAFAPDAVARIRDTGFSGPVFALASESIDAATLTALGFTGGLRKPLTTETIKSLTSQLDAYDIVSEHHFDLTLSDLVDDYIEELGRRVERLAALIASGTPDDVTTFALKASFTTSAYGFEPIAETFRRIAETDDADALPALARRLADQLRRIRKPA